MKNIQTLDQIKTKYYGEVSAIGLRMNLRHYAYDSR